MGEPLSKIHSETPGDPEAGRRKLRGITLDKKLRAAEQEVVDIESALQFANKSLEELIAERRDFYSQ